MINKLYDERHYEQQKLTQLRQFLVDGRPDTISVEHWDLLFRQVKVMEEYVKILDLRISEVI